MPTYILPFWYFNIGYSYLTTISLHYIWALVTKFEMTIVLMYNLLLQSSKLFSNLNFIDKIKGHIQISLKRFHLCHFKLFHLSTIELNWIRRKSTSTIPKYFPKNFGNFQKIRIWQHVNVSRTWVRCSPGRAGVGKPPAGLG